MLVRIDEIQLTKRVRQDLGDLSDLMDSIRLHGLINPVVITHEKELIAGERRYQAVKRLGWTSIPVIIKENTSESSRLRLEIEENLHRKNLSDEELEQAYARLEKMQQPSFWMRLWLWLKRLWRRLFRR